ncbi:MAG: integration host factor subunit beta [Deltaproteobacteria bacterium]|nr:integration host factor subunit beta [Deltaproteobacteria bacterium]
MTKSELIEKVADHIPGERKKDAEVIVNAVFDRMVDALQQGDRIEIRGFGSFHLRQRRERVGRDPKTGSQVEVAAKKVPFFKVGKELRLRVDGQWTGPRPEFGSILDIDNEPESKP